MSRIMFTVSYVVPDGKRAEYLGLMQRLSQFYASTGVDYAVMEDKAQHNHFCEVFRYASEEAFEASDDPETTRDVADVIDAVYGIVTGVRYSTHVSVG